MWTKLVAEMNKMYNYSKKSFCWEGVCVSRSDEGYLGYDNFHIPYILVQRLEAGDLK